MARLQRAVIELSLVDDEPLEAIAKRLGITPGHARVLLHRAREHVRHCSYEVAPASPPARTAARGRRAERPSARKV
jgi:DNA-directed RNA polymerase specialized sigma24 family protein